VRNPLPCKYKDYFESRWYSRLVFDEFHIQFDQYPEKEIIIDKIASEKLSNEDLNQWHSSIRNYWINNRNNWGEISPFEFVYYLRNLRKTLFNIDYFSYRKSSLIPEELNLEKLPKGKYKVILDGSDLLPLNKQIELFSRADCIFEFYISEEFKNKIENEEITILENPGDLDVNKLKNDLIISLDIWYSHLLRNNGIAFYSFIDNREWFSALLLDKSQSIDSFLKVPENINYNKILTEIHNHNRNRELVFVEKALIRNSNGAFLKAPIYRKKDCWLDKIIKEKSLKEITGFFVKKDGSWKECSDEEKDKRFASIFLIPENEIKIAPVFFKKMTSPLSLSYENGGFFTSFNYYFTDNLKEWYLKYDKTKLNWDNFLLDYLFVNDKKYETIPLYNKALLGCTKDGELFVQPSLWNNINCEIGDKNLCFTSNNIDDNNEATIYFPKDPKLAVEEAGAIFITIVQDYIWKIQKNSALIPPFGVVIKIKDNINISEGDCVRWSVDWINKKYEKDNWDWLIGGFNSLILNGKDLMKTKLDSQINLEKEGWYNESSKLTQETQLLDDIQQPRSFVGKAGSYILIGSVVGRFPFSHGATFSDESSLAQYAISRFNIDEKMDFLLNLDGGASSVLGAKKDGEENIIIIPPSASATNCAGIPRMVPSTLQIEF
jgi:hypothetical protein